MNLKYFFINGERKSHLDRNSKGFTLAEVLITLGIIGIVAAMTIPTLIANYQKKQTVTKLKQTYSMISQALTMAQSEHGDTTTWALDGIIGADTSDPNIDVRKILKTFAQTYFIPYVKVTKDYGYTNFSSIGYDGLYSPTEGIKRNNYGYNILLSNNVLLSLFIGTSGTIQNPDGTTTHKYSHIFFRIDTNAFDGPNMQGKDSFLTKFDLNKRVFEFHNYGQGSRTQYLNNCKADSQICGYLIYLDGWEIKDDYPWQ